MGNDLQRFKLFRQFNTQPPPTWLGSRSNLTPFDASKNFPGHRLQDKLVRALANHAALPIKEIIECGEMFERVRRKVLSPTLIDLCCGHGLLGVYFALFERSVEKVVLVDPQRPPSHDKLMAAVDRVAPWVRPKVTFLESPIEDPAIPITRHSHLIAAHACGPLTDRCLDLALLHRTTVAVMPCCYPKRTCPGPRSLQRALGLETAYDVARTYRLENAGFTTHWTGIPPVVTPMHRILIARPMRATAAGPTTTP